MDFFKGGLPQVVPIIKMTGETPEVCSDKEKNEKLDNIQLCKTQIYGVLRILDRVHWHVG